MLSVDSQATSTKSPINLKSINDKALIDKTEGLVRNERELLTDILHHLREINRRRLFSSMGYKSLFDFTVRHLKYPEDQAYRRISAMKLINEIPEIEEKINTGEISLTHIGLAQSLFRQEKKIEKEMSREQKIKVFDQIAKKPVREAERITLSLSSIPECAKPDRVHQVSDQHIEMKFIASVKLQEKLEHVKGLIAHKHPDISLGELFEQLCELGISAWNPATKRLPFEKTAAPRKRCVRNASSQVSYIPNQLRRKKFQKAQSKCENCGSVYALELDHITPLAKRGSSTAENLRVLCRSCNQRSAIQEFGQETMDIYINPANR